MMDPGGMMGGGPPPGPPPPSIGGPPGAAPGPTGPAAIAAPPGGEMMRGRVEVTVALRMLTKALAMMGAESKEGQEIASALAKLGKTFGETDPTLERAEAKIISDNVPAVSTPDAGQQKAFAQAAQSRLGSMGMGQGQPPGPPGAA